MSSLYLTGARRRKRVLKEETEWNLYETALILRIDTATGAAETCVQYCTPLEARPNETASTIFKSASLVGPSLYACTKTEVLIFKVPEFENIGYVSLPCFHDLHHVTPGPDGHLLVANTGLDMVVKCSLQNDVLEACSVLGEPPWARFSASTDYRKIETTKPHKSHPNFVFEMNDEIWVTRFHQRDAICLSDPEKRIDIAVQAPHDGIVRGDKVYFTTVDGRVVIASSNSLQVEEIVDLKQINGGNALLGWCRGLLLEDERTLWVGFSRIRKTWQQENVRWVKSVLRDGMKEKPTHVALYDLVDKRLIQEFDLEEHGMHVVFSILPAIG